MALDPLVIEDGTLIPNADSYGTVAGLVSYAARRGVTIPADDTAIVAMLKAMDYIGLRSDQFVGRRVSGTQALDWPRKGVYDEEACAPLPITTIPPKLIEAQYIAAMVAWSGTDLSPVVGTTGRIQSEKVGPLSTTYAFGTDYSNQPRVPAFEAAIATLCERRAVLSTFRG